MVTIALVSAGQSSRVMNKATRSPIANDPDTFTMSVPQGNPGPNSRRQADVTRKRPTAPPAPPRAMSKIVVMHRDHKRGTTCLQST